MSKVLFLIFEGFDDASGISKKILAQVVAVRQLGHEVVLSYLKQKNGVYRERVTENDKVLTKFSSIKPISKIQLRTNFGALVDFVESRLIDTVFIRYTHIGNPAFVWFLNKLNKLSVRIILEVPTYPYDMEYRNVSGLGKLPIWIERLSRTRFHRYIDRVVTFSNAESIFNVPTIRLSNGVDLEKARLKSDLPFKGDSLNMIAVGSLHFWHGFDRLIHGIYQYQQHTPNINLRLSIVGPDNGNETELYRRLVDEYGLEQVVTFTGSLTGAALNEAFDRAHIAVGCLGCHRKGITYIKSLKNREYCARGIPFMYSEIDGDFEGAPYVLKVPPDESPIEIEAILQFLKTAQFDPKEMRAFAEQHLSWEAQLLHVFGRA